MKRKNKNPLQNPREKKVTGCRPKRSEVNRKAVITIYELFKAPGDEKLTYPVNIQYDNSNVRNHGAKSFDAICHMINDMVTDMCENLGEAMGRALTKKDQKQDSFEVVKNAIESIRVEMEELRKTTVSIGRKKETDSECLKRVRRELTEILLRVNDVISLQDDMQKKIDVINLTKKA